MKKLILISFLVLIVNGLYSQSDPPENPFSRCDSAVRSYPYFGPCISPYAAFIGGVEFLNPTMWEAGMAFNIADIRGIYSGGRFGPTITYKRSLNSGLHGMDFDLGLYTYITLGLNYNYYTDGVNKIGGFKPFIGTTIFHCEISYGYNFFSNKKNPFEELTHHVFKLRYYLPIPVRKQPRQREWSNE